MTDLHVSPAGRTFIESKEGRVLHSYQDIRGIWTIGIGCTGPNIGPGMTITEAECDQMFADRLANEFEPGVNKLLGNAPTTQGQFDAMVSLAFNIGVEAFAGSIVLERHLAGDYDTAADDFLHWDHVNGVENQALADRRGEEAQMYEDASP